MKNEKNYIKWYKIFRGTAEFLSKNPSGVRGGSIPIFYICAHAFELLLKGYCLYLGYKEENIYIHDLKKLNKMIVQKDLEWEGFVKQKAFDFNLGKEFKVKSNFNFKEGSQDSRILKSYIFLFNTYLEHGGLRYPKEGNFIPVDSRVFRVLDLYEEYICQKVN
jgi:hypothetical protein